MSEFIPEVGKIYRLDDRENYKVISMNANRIQVLRLKDGMEMNSSERNTMSSERWKLVEEQVTSQSQEIKVKQIWEVVGRADIAGGSWPKGTQFTTTLVEATSVYGRREGGFNIYIAAKETILKYCKFIRDIPDFESQESTPKINNQHDFSNPYLVTLNRADIKVKACKNCLEPEGGYDICTKRYIGHNNIQLVLEKKIQDRMSNRCELIPEIKHKYAIQSLGGSLGYQRVSGVDALVDTGWNCRPEKK
jgi:hypothetical protein